MKSDLQEGSCNCGPFVLKNALALVKGHRTDQLTTESAVKMRHSCSVE